MSCIHNKRVVAIVQYSLWRQWYIIYWQLTLYYCNSSHAWYWLCGSKCWNGHSMHAWSHGSRGRHFPTVAEMVLMVEKIWYKKLCCTLFFVLLVSYISRSIIGTNLFPLSTALYVVCMPINLQPYKKRYMSVIDSLIFATLTLLSAAFVYVSPSFAHLTKILGLILALELFSFVVYKLTLKILFSSIKQRLPAVKQSLLTCNG